MTPLDPVLNSALVERQNGPSVGVRVSRRLASRLAAEVSIDYQGGHLRTTDATRTGVEATRAAFSSVFNAILNRGFPVTNLQLTSTAVTDADDRGARLATLGALVFNLPRAGAFEPYVTGGAGVLSRRGETPRITMTGNYRFVLGNVSRIDETDAVVVRTVVGDSAAVGMVGGGFKTFFSSRFGIRVDTRFQFSPGRTDTLVDATPRGLVDSPSTALTFFSTPSLRFANFSQPDLQSTLSGSAIKDFQTFTGEGTERQFSVTAGMIVRLGSP
jgi:hypothetical protein